MGERRWDAPPRHGEAKRGATAPRGGAVVVCVAKLSEAEVMLAAGIDDVLITTELVGPIKARRLAELITRWPRDRARVVVDSRDGASALDAALRRAVEGLIDVNVGQDRCGMNAHWMTNPMRDLKRLRW